jgi:hypothetical protein
MYLHGSKSDVEDQMKKRLLVPFAGATALIVLAAAHSSPFAPGARTMMLAQTPKMAVYFAVFNVRLPLY